MAEDDPLIAAQALALAALAWPGGPRWAVPRAVRLAAAGAVLAGGAFAALGAAPHGARLTPRVAPPQDAPLHEDGVYAVSRHPIYTGLLTAAAGAAVLRRRPEPLLAWAALAVVLHRKTAREEEHLLARFGPRYAVYRARVPRLLGIPAR